MFGFARTDQQAITAKLPVIGRMTDQMRSAAEANGIDVAKRYATILQTLASGFADDAKAAIANQASLEPGDGKVKKLQRDAAKVFHRVSAWASDVMALAEATLAKGSDVATLTKGADALTAGQAEVATALSALGAELDAWATANPEASADGLALAQGREARRRSRSCGAM